MIDEKYPEKMQEIIEDFLHESRENLSDLELIIVDLEKDPQNEVLLNSVFRTVHSLKGAADFLGFTRLVGVSHKLESLLNQLRKGNMTLTPAIMDVIFETIDVMKALLHEVETGTTAEMDIEGTIGKIVKVLAPGERTPVAETSDKEEPKEEQEETKKKALSKKGESKGGRKKTEGKAKKAEGVANEPKVKEEDLFLPPPSPPEPSFPQAEPELQESVPESVQENKKVPEGAHETTIRVDVERLDSVMNLVGELVLTRNRLFQINQELEALYGDDEKIQSLLDNSLHLNLITTDLQLAVLKTRMQPMKKVFSKIPRMVRDIARKRKKEVELIIVGEETEVDRSIIEEIGDPLVHLIRNAVDHGIEISDFRGPLGKPEKGFLRVAAAYDGDHIVIEIEDDGKGMDPERMRQAAVDKGVMDAAEAERLSERDCLNLIFLPGFSTATQVTDISGRGVGLDVVKTNISRLNGTVNVDSRIGEGTLFRIRLPLTVAIIQSLMVGAGDETFAIPLSSVIETLCISPDEVQTIDGNEVISLREEILPVVRLSHELDIPLPEQAEDEKMYVVVTGLAEKKVGLMVTKLYGQEEIVIKTLGQYLTGRREFSGATITGDGKVVMILDIGGLLDQCVAV